MLAQTIVAAAGLYALIGVIFATGCVGFGLRRIDPAAAKSGWGLRLIIFPGVAALWPVLALRVWR